jgi:hypothetical protein
MPNPTEDCKKKATIDSQADQADKHIDKVLGDPSLSQNLKKELNLAKDNLRNIMGDHHHL